MGETFKDVFEFQEKYPTKEDWERVLRTMDADEIMRLARTCGNMAGRCYYGRFAQEAVIREKNRQGGVSE